MTNYPAPASYCYVFVSVLHNFPKRRPSSQRIFATQELLFLWDPHPRQCQDISVQALPTRYVVLQNFDQLLALKVNRFTAFATQ